MLCPFFSGRPNKNLVGRPNGDWNLKHATRLIGGMVVVAVGALNVLGAYVASLGGRVRFEGCHNHGRDKCVCVGFQKIFKNGILKEKSYDYLTKCENVEYWQNWRIEALNIRWRRIFRKNVWNPVWFSQNGDVSRMDSMSGTKGAGGSGSTTMNPQMPVNAWCTASNPMCVVDQCASVSLDEDVLCRNTFGILLCSRWSSRPLDSLESPLKHNAGADVFNRVNIWTVW